MESQTPFPHDLEVSFLPTSVVASVSDTAVSSEVYIKHLKLSRTTNFEELFLHNGLVVPIGQISQHALQTHEVSYLAQLYNTTNLSGYKALHICHLSI